MEYVSASAAYSNRRIRAVINAVAERQKTIPKVAKAFGILYYKESIFHRVMERKEIFYGET